MRPERTERREKPGPIAYMASNGVAANLLMLGIVAAGLVALTGLEQEGWPEIPFNMFEVSVPFPGAAPGEVEEAVVVKIEDEVRGLSDVKAVRSVAAPGMASVRVEVVSGTDMGAKRDEIESAIGRIQTFPAGAERPRIREMTNAQSVIRLVLYGDAPERSLKELARRVEDDLAALPSVSQVETTGARDYEISVEVPLQRLRALGLTLADVASAIRRNSLDLSAGSIETEESEVRVRTLGQSYDQQDFERIVLLSRGDGTVVRLGDVARVRDGFRESNLIVRHDGMPAVFVEISRAPGERVLSVARAVRAHLDDAVIPSLPEGVGVAVLNDDATVFTERAGLLVKNGALGLLLVLVALGLFLELRLAFWVAVGLAVSGIGALAVMLAFDVAIHAVSIFAFVLAIGIVVDDAIVVAEHIHLERTQGAPGLVAAIRGARRIKTPLTFAVLTTIVAFIPLLFVPAGFMEAWRALPIVVVAMLAISLIESLFVLPNHLSHGLRGPGWEPGSGFRRRVARVQGRADATLNRFVQGPLDRWLGFAADRPGVTVSGAVALFVLVVSLVPAGVVRTTFTTEVESDFATATLEMPDGTTAERTHAVAREVEAAGRRAVERLSEGRNPDAPPLLAAATVTVGRGPRIEGGGIDPAPDVGPPANVATVDLKLLSAERRRIATGDVVQAWREEVGDLPQARGVAFFSEIVNLGNPVEVALSHPDPERLLAAAASVVDGLRRVGGVFDIRSDHAGGVPEVRVGMRPEARTLGLALDDLAGQTRSALFGVEALRVQRGREEVRVYARLPEEQRNSIADLEDYPLRTASGAEVPLRRAASLEMGTSPQAVRRLDGKRVVTVTADVDESAISGGEANDALENDILAELVAADPDLGYSFGGEQQQQLDSLGALNRGFAVAMLTIFALLAIPLRSYTKPFIVMAVIPFGLVGVVLGHWILGVALSAESFVGLFGLSGVVVNDSLVMIDFIDRKLEDGVPARTAIVEGAKGRFRPIMLTSLTTFLGFTPLILEDAVHARFFVPFAASIGVGIVFTTAILMILVPALTSIRLRWFAARRPSARGTLVREGAPA